MTSDLNVRRSILARQSWWDRIDTAAKRRGTSVNGLVKELCSAALDAEEGKGMPQPEPEPARPAGAVLKPLDTAPGWMRRGWHGQGWR